MTSRTEDPNPTRFEVELERGDFLYFNWTLAFERPLIPFFLYTFVALTLASMLGVWPAGRTFALAVLVPLLGYNLWIWFSGRSLWRRFPQLRQPRVYTFREEAYRVRTAAGSHSVPYRDVVQVLESRRGFYLLRADGSGDILPKRAVGDADGCRSLLAEKIGPAKHSSFL